MARKRPFDAIEGIDPAELASFQRQIRKRYSDEQIPRALEQGVEAALGLRRLPKLADWAALRKERPSMLTEWQVYRLFDSRRGAWATFQFLIRKRLLDAGTEVRADGTIA